MAADVLADELGSASALLERLDAQFEAGVSSRVAGWLKIQEAWGQFTASIEASGHSPAFVALSAILACVVTVGTTTAISRWLGTRAPRSILVRTLFWPVSAALASIGIWAIIRLLIPEPVIRGALLNCVTISAVATAICLPLAAGARGLFWRWRRDLSVAIGLTAAGLAVLACFRAWNASYELRDLFATFGVALPFTVLVATAYIKHRSLIATAVSCDQPAGSFRRALGLLWPWLVVALVSLAFIFIQIGLTLGRPVRGGPLLLSLLLVLAAPHLDVLIENRGRLATQTSGDEIRVALWRTLRVAGAAAILGTLATLWLLPVLDAIGVSRGLVLLKTAEILLLVLVIAFCWNWVSILAGRLRVAPAGDPEADAAAVGTRLSTVGPLLAGATKGTLLTLGALTMLIMLGINVWPLITGLSIFGLAIGLGSQTLVKDVVAGMFFLVDDAFRQGEYIETSGAKGTVEKISLRSVSLRHQRGAVATIPYGQIGKILNYSREWVIEKMLFRVALDTDVEVVRKLFKKIGQEIAADPELSVDLLEPFKSQGIAALEEGTLVIRGKFKAKAGRQFQIRKAILSKVRQTLQENGIKLVPKPLQVPDTTGRA